MNWAITLAQFIFKFSHNSNDDLYEQIIPECYIQILQKNVIMNQSNNSQPNWEEVQGLSWIFVEDSNHE